MISTQTNTVKLTSEEDFFFSKGKFTRRTLKKYFREITSQTNTTFFKHKKEKKRKIHKIQKRMITTTSHGERVHTHTHR